MAISAQKIKKLAFRRLKGLANCEVEFGDSLTAVMGTNCSGKTTVLQALACVYRPIDTGGVEFKFPMFFRPSTDSPWSGSEFEAFYEEREEAEFRASESKLYLKAEDRWTPRYSSRPQRSVSYLLLRECVPEVELVSQQSFVSYKKIQRVKKYDTLVRKTAGQVLNRQYEQLHEVQYSRGSRKSVGVTTSGITYSALAMSAGEQRVFRILETVFSAPKYGLILIDEIDLFLHQDALQKLLKILNDHCEANNKQLVFTTHFPPVSHMYERIDVVSLHRTEDRTLVWKGYSYDALQYITGDPQSPMTLHVEDDVAEEIVRKIAGDLGIRSRIKTCRYGPAINGYTLGAGLILKDWDVQNELVVLDGDVDSSFTEKQKHIKKLLTGDGEAHKQKRESLRRLIRCFRPRVAGSSPEQILHGCIRTLDAGEYSEEDAELIKQVQAILNPLNTHGFVDNVVEIIGSPRSVVISQIVRLAAKTEDWERYTRVVRIWMRKRKDSLNL